jgi:hypothetical protein
VKLARAEVEVQVLTEILLSASKGNCKVLTQTPRKYAQMSNQFGLQEQLLLVVLYPVSFKLKLVTLNPYSSMSTF